MVLEFQKTHKPIQVYTLSNVCFNNFAQKSSLGGVLALLPYSWLSLALDLAQMVLDVRKNIKPTQFYLLNNLFYNNFAQKSSPGGALNLGLLLAVYGPGLGPDGPGCPEKP